MQGVDAVIFWYNLIFITSAQFVGLDGAFGFFFQGFLWGGVQGSEGERICSKKKGMD